MDISQLFPALMSQDNQLRAHAEGVYSSYCGSHTEDLVIALTNCLAHHEVRIPLYGFLNSSFYFSL